MICELFYPHKILYGLLYILQAEIQTATGIPIEQTENRAGILLNPATHCGHIYLTYHKSPSTDISFFKSVLNEQILIALLWYVFFCTPFSLLFSFRFFLRPKKFRTRNGSELRHAENDAAVSSPDLHYWIWSRLELLDADLRVDRSASFFLSSVSCHFCTSSSVCGCLSSVARTAREPVLFCCFPPAFVWRALDRRTARTKGTGNEIPQPSRHIAVD